jgi:nucleotide-binding universal stress UspA family protein
MMMRILLPVDGSKYSRVALDFVASRSTLIGSEPQVEVLNVQLPVPVRATQLVGKAHVRSYYTEEAEKVLKPAQARLRKAGLAASARYVVGNPAEEIAAAAVKSKADLIVIGSHGRSALKGLLLGSVTNAVLAQSKAPVLILRNRGSPPADSLKVGIAVDGSKYGRAAVSYVLRHPQLFGAAPKLTLIHVVQDYLGAVMPDMAGIALPAFTIEEVRSLQSKTFEKAVAPVRKLLAKAGAKAEEACLVGNAGDELAAYAKKKKLDLLVMGSHGYGAFKAAVMGSVATRTAATGDVPLLLIRHA